MENFTTETEKKLWEWLWKSQQELAKRLLKDTNDALVKEGREGDWPAMQEWDDMVGSSHAIFLRSARELIGIPHEPYLHILRENIDAMNIVDDLLEGK